MSGNGLLCYIMINDIVYFCHDLLCVVMFYHVILCCALSNLKDCTLTMYALFQITCIRLFYTKKNLIHYMVYLLMAQSLKIRNIWYMILMFNTSWIYSYVFDTPLGIGCIPIKIFGQWTIFLGKASWKKMPLLTSQILQEHERNFHCFTRHRWIHFLNCFQDHGSNVEQTSGPNLPPRLKENI